MTQSIVAVIILAVLFTDTTARIGGLEVAYTLAHRVPNMILNEGLIINYDFIDFNLVNEFIKLYMALIYRNYYSKEEIKRRN
jgi:hypothetical protein